MGPPGFAAYARLRFLTDPTYEGQSENDVDPHRAAIGADFVLIERLVADRRRDAVVTDPADDQPAYR